MQGSSNLVVVVEVADVALLSGGEGEAHGEQAEAEYVHNVGVGWGAQEARGIVGEVIRCGIRFIVFMGFILEKSSSKVLI
jgi:hypothetical protein